MLAAEKTKVTFVAPVGIGLSLFVAELMGVAWTGGGLNPARAFGAEVIGGFRGYHWIYCGFSHSRLSSAPVSCTLLGPYPSCVKLSGALLHYSQMISSL